MAMSDTKRIPNLNAPGALAVCDGQQRIGTIVKDAGEFFAFDAGGKCLGTFDTAIEAARKIPARGNAR
jgi:hypothetical protein